MPASNAPAPALRVGFGTPFAEQIEFFRQKLNLPTDRWDDINRSAHDRAFIVAGAAKADLLHDLREAVARAIEDGRGIEAFRKDFREIVKKHGWTGWTGEGSKAGEAWRTRVIYQTNMATSYAAGRYRQLTDPDFLRLRPYWRYVHSDSVLHPRPHHKHWGDTRLTLRHDHPFWQTHFPPNGWGCRCRVVPVAAPEADAATAPPEGWNEINPKSGAPLGIDKGFDYQPGASVSRPLQEFIDQKLINLHAPIGAAMWKSLAPALAQEREAAYVAWLGEILADPVKRGRVQVVGVLADEVLAWLAFRKIQPVTAEIAVGDAVIVGRKAQRHMAHGDALTAEEWSALPGMLNAPERIFYDTRSGHLIYVAASEDPRLAKMAVEFDYRLKKGKGEINLIVSAFKVPSKAIEGEIKGGFFEVVR